jgi:hypothetical protein
MRRQALAAESIDSAIIAQGPARPDSPALRSN